jgi:hypothetical protein
MNGDHDPAGAVQDEDILDIRVPVGNLQDISHLSSILG